MTANESISIEVHARITDLLEEQEQLVLVLQWALKSIPMEADEWLFERDRCFHNKALELIKKYDTKS